eukprot:INCI3980.2.p1 GENE.INCI3980.2~~INCI3980.2.p1  ORF type:complete len:625 (-),score=117.35 INCI3980.2:2650-4524(-)
MLSGLCRRSLFTALQPRRVLPLRTLPASQRASLTKTHQLVERNAVPSLRFFASAGATDNVSLSARSAVIDDRLSNDVKTLGALLGESIHQEDPDVFESVERLRSLGREWRRKDGDPKAFDDMVEDVKGMSNKKLLSVARSFANFLSLSNSTETHHRVRKLGEAEAESGTDLPLWAKDDSCGGTLRRLVQDEGHSREDVLKALAKQSVEIVLTAHPTEVNRKTILNFHKKIRELLHENDQPHLSKYARRRVNEKLDSLVQSLWHSDELNRKKPTPMDEALVGFNVVASVLWDAVPGFLRKLDDISRQELGESLPLGMAPIRIASWMGGDRDGNPNVTPEITQKVSMMSRWFAATLFLEDIQELRRQLSLRHCSDELRNRTKGAQEPYRELLKDLEARLMTTVNWTLNEMGQPASYTVGGLGEYDHTEFVKEQSLEPIVDCEELAEPLQLLYQSLIDTNLGSIANGPLVDTIRRVAAFGMALLPLDLRQESGRHSEALNAITEHLGLGSYSSWTEDERRTWLVQELTSRRPLLPSSWDFKNDLNFSSTVVDTLETFRLAAKLPKKSLGAYVISQCQQASDILAVMVLQQNAGVRRPLRVVPLFETLDDLQRAPDTVDALFFNASVP